MRNIIIERLAEHIITSDQPRKRAAHFDRTDVGTIYIKKLSSFDDISTLNC